MSDNKVLGDTNVQVLGDTCIHQGRQYLLREFYADPEQVKLILEQIMNGYRYNFRLMRDHLFSKGDEFCMTSDFAVEIGEIDKLDIANHIVLIGFKGGQIRSLILYKKHINFIYIENMLIS